MLSVVAVLSTKNAFFTDERVGIARESEMCLSDIACRAGISSVVVYKLVAVSLSAWPMTVE